MAAITIGVPVYNEADRLDRCLELLRAQTFSDFEVLIFDNASTDATGQIAQAFCARDPRFSYVRQPVNRGAIGNFNDVLKAARSPYFIWRAADDSADLNYLEVLHGLLEADPTKRLAVGRIVGTFRGEVERTTRFPRLKGDGKLDDQWRLMFGASPSWVYGLYRREALIPILDRIVRDYGDDTWAWDFLLMLPFFMDAAVAGTDATSFEAALRPAPRRARPEAATKDRTGPGWAPGPSSAVPGHRPELRRRADRARTRPRALGRAALALCRPACLQDQTHTAAKRAAADRAQALGVFGHASGRGRLVAVSIEAAGRAAATWLGPHLAVVVGFGRGGAAGLQEGRRLADPAVLRTQDRRAGLIDLADQRRRLRLDHGQRIALRSGRRSSR